MINDKITIVICNFNTTELTNNCVSSILNNCGFSNYLITVLDNSDKTPYVSNYSNIKIIDNTHRKFIDYSKILAQFAKCGMKENGNASLKHCYAINWLMSICQSKYMMLFDSDTILKKRIDFIDSSIATAAGVERHGQLNWCKEKRYSAKTRFLPFIQFFNIEMLHKANCKYFDPSRIYGGLCQSANYYDTGASFYEDVQHQKLPYREIAFYDYVDHIGHGSWIAKKL